MIAVISPLTAWDSVVFRSPSPSCIFLMYSSPPHFACDGYVPEVQREASGDEPVHCKLIRNEAGELVMQTAVPC